MWKKTKVSNQPTSFVGWIWISTRSFSIQCCWGAFWRKVILAHEKNNLLYLLIFQSPFLPFFLLSLLSFFPRSTLGNSLQESLDELIQVNYCYLVGYNKKMLSRVVFQKCWLRSHVSLKYLTWFSNSLDLSLETFSFREMSMKGLLLGYLW